MTVPCHRDMSSTRLWNQSHPDSGIWHPLGNVFLARVTSATKMPRAFLGGASEHGERSNVICP